MAKYSGTYSCGHEGTVGIIGPTKDREWKKERAFSKLCPECYEKWLEEEKQRKNQEATEKAKEMELPELTGTEKQVSWANTLRQRFIDHTDKFIEDEGEDWNFWIKKYPELRENKIQDLILIRDDILESKTDSKYYIDNRDIKIIKLLAEEIKNAFKTDEEKIEEKQAISVKLESTVFPENSITNVAAEITIKDDKITVMFEKNQDFRLLVKSLGYEWSGIWEKDISETTGTAEDRAAELGNKLLNAGFPIYILDANVREKAIKGIYEIECTRWIYKRKNKDILAINWKERNEKLYNTARRLPGSKWDSPSVIVKIGHYKEVEEFAEIYGFKFTSNARKAIEEYKEKLQNITVVNPAVVEKKEIKDGLKEILNSGSDILDDLKD